MALASFGAMLWYRHLTKRTLKRLGQMLDAAIRGTFSEEDFDESMLSAVEAKLGRYLAAKALQAAISAPLAWAVWPLLSGGGTL